MRFLRAALVAVALLAIAAPSATAATRYAAPAGAASGDCSTPMLACRIDYAVNSAPAGSDVIVPSGDYTIGTPLNPGVAITLQGTGGTRPRLLSSSGSTPPLELRYGGVARHLEIRASGSGQDAMTLEKSVGEDLLLTSATGDGAKVVGSPATTVLRDSVVVSNASGAFAALKLRDGSGQAGGDITLVNVTASGPNAAAILCETSTGTTRLVNTIARGLTDIEANKNGVRCVSSHSSYRPASSPGLAAGPGDVSADPQFATGLRLADASPLVDAGVTDPRLGSVDPDGRARIIGARPDIGAYESPAGKDAPAAAPAPAPAPSTSPSPAPVTPAPAPGTALLSDEAAKAPDADGDGTPDAKDPTPNAPAAITGRTVVVAPARGRVVVRPPGASRFTELEGSTFVPTGSLVDTRGGTVALSSVIDAKGTTQTGEFRGGVFEVRQAAESNGMTDIYLRGGDFSKCPKASRKAAASAKAKPPARRVWAKDDKGRFRTHGRNSVATARGTAWLTEDTCAGTLTKVTKDAVSVRPIRGGGKAKIVRAGHQLLVRGPRAR